LASALVVAVFALLPIAAALAHPPEISVRDILAAENVPNAALVDAITPMPATEGKVVLFVDGSFYVQATPDVTDYVCSVAQGGMPIVVIGPGFQDLCQRLKVGYEVARYLTASGMVDMPIAASALNLYRGQTLDGSPFVAELQIAGDGRSPRSAIREALGWLERLASEVTPQAGIGTQDVVAAEAPDWSLYAYREWSSGDTWQDKGRLNLHKYYYKLINDGSSEYDWRDVKLSMQIVPGTVAYGSGWKNDYTDVEITVDDMCNWLHLIDYDPTTTVGQTTISVNIGVTAGSEGAAVTASMSWSYSASDVEVLDSSDFYVELFKLRHEINEGANVGKYTYLHRPGLCIRTLNEGFVNLDEWYRAQWANKHWYGWTHWTSPWVELIEYSV
jgi:hypothetical protein